MDKTILMILEEWARLESIHHWAERGSCEAGERQTKLTEKENELLAMRTQTKDEALVHLRFCATFVEQNCGDRSVLAMSAIRHAINVLSWPQT